MSSVNMFLTLGKAVRSREGQKTGKREGGKGRKGGSWGWLGEGIVYRSRLSVIYLRDEIDCTFGFSSMLDHIVGAAPICN